MTRTTIGIVAALLLAGAGQAHADGKKVYDTACAGCHAAGVLGAPRPGNAGDWAARAKRGASALYRSALQGTPKGMPPKGGRTDIPDADIRAAVDYMLAQLPELKSAAKAAPKPAAAPSVPPPAVAAAPAAAPRAATTRPASSSADANAFNRLLRPVTERNPPPSQDGIHDVDVDATHVLQSPREAFASLPKSNAGNRVDWVKALGQKSIAPRWDRTDPNAEPVSLDLNIVREVKGSMPDVVYPHKQHTEWLDCSNCHPAIFVPQKGANQISMASILLGEKCGACHGRVAFPVSECRLCHSRKKTTAAAQGSGGSGKP